MPTYTNNRGHEVLKCPSLVVAMQRHRSSRANTQVRRYEPEGSSDNTYRLGSSNRALIAPHIRKAHTLRISFLPVFLLLFIVPQTTYAQTPVAIEGLEVIAERQYASDADGTVDLGSDGVFLATARVYVFDSAANADSTWETLVAAEMVRGDVPDDDDSVTYEQIELEDVGDRAMVLSLSADLAEGETGVFRTVIVQKEAVIVTVTIIAGSVEATEIADTIAEAMIEREPGDGDSVYDGTGESSGGVWEIFLPEDAAELGDLRAYADKETRPIQG